MIVLFAIGLYRDINSAGLCILHNPAELILYLTPSSGGRYCNAIRSSPCVPLPDA